MRRENHVQMSSLLVSELRINRQLIKYQDKVFTFLQAFKLDTNIEIKHEENKLSLSSWSSLTIISGVSGVSYVTIYQGTKFISGS